MYGYTVVGHPTWEQLIWTADIDRLKGKVGRRQVRRIRNDMDEAEARRRTKKCSICRESGHTFKKMPHEKSSGRKRHRRGTKRERVTHECTLRRGGCICTCNKPLLLLRPCSHVMAACSTMAQHPGRYLSDYFNKEEVVGNMP